nr:NUDIX hydrolase [Phytoactinopolyspora mesophila]
MVVLLDDAQEHALMLWRHRFISDVWNWELPGGLVDEGESPSQTAARELEEETGYQARTLEHLVTFEPMIGTVTCPHHVFLARHGEPTGAPTETTEMQRMEWVRLQQIPELIRVGEVKNSGTLVALLHVLAIKGTDGCSR